MKILFVIDALRKGGIRTSLLNLLSNIDYSRYEVSIFCFHLTEEDKKNIPKEVQIIQSNWLFNIVATTSDELREISKLAYFIRKIMAVMCSILNSNRVYNLIFKTEHRKFKFDIGISFTNNVSDHSLYFGANKFVLEHVQALKKITWLHADFEKMNLNTKINNNEYAKFDKVVTVSNSVKETFLKYNINLANKTFIIYNTLDTSKLINCTSTPIPEKQDDAKLNCISVIRFDDNKDPLYMIEIAKELKEHKIPFCWRIIGDGELFEKVKNEITKNNLAEYIKLYGFLKNPYPYMNISDVYISTSDSEGYSLSLIEAMYFNLLIVSGYYKGIYEIINDLNGIVIKKEVSNYVDILSRLYHKKNSGVNLKEKKYLINSNEKILHQFENLIKS